MSPTEMTILKLGGGSVHCPQFSSKDDLKRILQSIPSPHVLEHYKDQELSTIMSVMDELGLRMISSDDIATSVLMANTQPHCNPGTGKSPSTVPQIKAEISKDTGSKSIKKSKTKLDPFDILDDDHEDVPSNEKASMKKKSHMLDTSTIITDPKAAAEKDVLMSAKTDDCLPKESIGNKPAKGKAKKKAFDPFDVSDDEKPSPPPSRPPLTEKEGSKTKDAASKKKSVKFNPLDLLDKDEESRAVPSPLASEEKTREVTSTLAKDNGKKFDPMDLLENLKTPSISRVAGPQIQQSVQVPEASRSESASAQPFTNTGNSIPHSVSPQEPPPMLADATKTLQKKETAIKSKKKKNLFDLLMEDDPEPSSTDKDSSLKPTTETSNLLEGISTVRKQIEQRDGSKRKKNVAGDLFDSLMEDDQEVNSQADPMVFLLIISYFH